MKNKYLVKAAIFWGLFIGMTMLVSRVPVNKFDLRITNVLQAYIPVKMDKVLAGLSVLGNFEVATPILLYLLWRLKNKKMAMMVFGVYLLGLMIEIMGKTWFNHPGTTADLYRYSLQVKLPTSSVTTNYSYPSGHGLRFTFVMLFWLYYWQKNIMRKLTWQPVMVISLLAIMLISVVSLGEHWTSDVVAGFLLGGGLVYLAVGWGERNKVS